jgi:hypothetical protein
MIGVRKTFSVFLGSLLWEEDQGIGKYHLMNWEIVHSPKYLGGLSSLNINLMTISFLCKCHWKLENVDGGLETYVEEEISSRKQTLPHRWCM